MAVDWGLAHRDLAQVEAIGVDELARRRGHRYLTLVYRTDRHRRSLLWVGGERQAVTLHAFFDWFGAARCVCSDMWRPYPYLTVVAERAGQAVHVLDQFHIMSHFSKAIDEVRAAAVRKLVAEGRAPVLKHSRWILLKRPEHLADAQQECLTELVRRNLRTARTYLLKEDFRSLWSYVSPYWAGRSLGLRCTRTTRSRLDPMKRVARMLRSHRRLILHWFRAMGQFSSGIVEGFNGKARVTTKAFGFRISKALELACIMHLPTCPSRFSPTDSADEDHTFGNCLPPRREQHRHEHHNAFSPSRSRPTMLQRGERSGWRRQERSGLGDAHHRGRRLQFRRYTHVT